jgi:hypothetical protein
MSFSSFSDVDFAVGVVDEVATEVVPEDVKKLVSDKPLFPTRTSDGWLGNTEHGQQLCVEVQRTAYSPKRISSSKLLLKP